MPNSPDQSLLDALAAQLPAKEWLNERDPHLIARMLDESAIVVRNAVKNRLDTGRAMELHYDDQILMLQHMLWHEGCHHDQIKLALKPAGRSATTRPGR